jgi:hypothetical protein
VSAALSQTNPGPQDATAHPCPAPATSAQVTPSAHVPALQVRKAGTLGYGAHSCPMPPAA